MKHLVHILLLYIGSSLLMLAAEAETSVGMDGRLTVTIPGSPITAKRQPRDSTVSISILHADPAQHRYTIQFSAELPGTYNLAENLMHSDGSDQPIPSIPVKVTSILPSTHNGALLPAKEHPYPFFTSYWAFLIAAIILWVLFAYPLFIRGRKRQVEDTPTQDTAPMSIDQILQPLLDNAAKNKLDDAAKARLEKAAIIQLHQLLAQSPNHSQITEKSTPYEIIQALHQEPMTSDAMEILEQWLHRPPHGDTTPTLTTDQHRKLAKSLLPTSQPHSDSP